MSQQPTLDATQIAILRREANLNNRPLARHLLSTAKYLGIGALVHAWFLGGVFDSQSAWSWGYLLAWPVPFTVWVLGWLLSFILYAVLLIAVCGALWWAFEEWATRRRAAAQDAEFRRFS